MITRGVHLTILNQFICTMFDAWFFSHNEFTTCSHCCVSCLMTLGLHLNGVLSSQYPDKTSNPVYWLLSFHISWIHSIVLHVGLLGIYKWGFAALWSCIFSMLTLHLGLRWMASSYISLSTKLSSRQETQQYSYSGLTPFMLLFLLNIMGGWFNPTTTCSLLYWNIWESRDSSMVTHQLGRTRSAAGLIPEPRNKWNRP